MANVKGYFTIHLSVIENDRFLSTPASADGPSPVGLRHVPAARSRTGASTRPKVHV